MKQKINLMFMIILLLMIVGFFVQGYAFHDSKRVVIDNSKYNVDRDTERNFNIWQFQRLRNYSLIFGGFTFFILIIYYLSSINKTKKKRKVKEK